MSSLVIEGAAPDAPPPVEFFGGALDTGIVCVFAHGAGAGHRSPFMRHMAALLAARGLDVLTFDFPYMAAGRKLPDRPPALEAAFLDAVDLALARSARARAVIVAGKSMGGRMATHIAAQPQRWRAAVPLAGALAFGYPLKPPGPRGGDRVSHLGRLAVPTLVVQGTRDTFGGPDDIRAAAVAVGAPDLVVRGVDSGDHSLKVRVSDGHRQAEVDAAIADDVVLWARQAAARVVPG